MTGFPINPPNAPLVNPQSGVITREWYKFFRDIQRVVGGPSDPFDDSGFLTALPVPPPVSAGHGDLSPPSPLLEAADPLSPPAQALVVSDPLIPPTAPVVWDDLMYPPFYGSN